MMRGSLRYAKKTSCKLDLQEPPTGEKEDGAASHATGAFPHLQKIDFQHALALTRLGSAPNDTYIDSFND